MMIRYASVEDLDILNKLDVHIALKELKNSIDQNRILVMQEDGRLIGWLRYNLFWDNIPFIKCVVKPLALAMGI